MNNQEIYAIDINKNPQLKNNLWLIDSLYGLVYSIVQVSLLYNNEQLTDSLYEKGIDYIEYMKKYFLKCVNATYLNEKRIKNAERELSFLNNIKKIGSLRMGDSYLISIAVQYTYNNADYSLEHTLWCYLLEYNKFYNFEIKNDTLFIFADGDTDKEYARIDNISDIIIKSQFLL